MNSRTRKAFQQLESQRFSGRCQDVSARTLRLGEAIGICDEILDEQEGISYEPTQWERIKNTARRIFGRAA